MPILCFSLKLVLGRITVILSFFPWVGFGFLDLDSQPWAFMCCILYLLACYKSIKLPENFFLIISVMLAGIFFSLLNTRDVGSFFTLRSVYNYLSVGFFFLGFYDYIIRFGFPYKILLTANYIWLIGAVVEFFNPAFIAYFAPVRTSFERGLTSFAPEPTFYAIFVFFSAWLLLSFSAYEVKKHAKFYVASIFCVFFVSKSSTVILYLILAYATYLILKILRSELDRDFFNSILLFFCAAMVFFISSKYVENSRVFNIAYVILDSGVVNLFSSDASAGERLDAITHSVTGSAKNFFLPAGLDGFSSVIGSKIMSWIGDFFHQLGLFGLLFVLLIFINLWDGTLRNLLEIFLLFIILLSAVPLAFPLVPMLLSVFFYKRRIKKHFVMRCV